MAPAIGSNEKRKVWLYFPYLKKKCLFLDAFLRNLSAHFTVSKLVSYRQWSHLLFIFLALTGRCDIEDVHLAERWIHPDPCHNEPSAKNLALILVSYQNPSQILLHHLVKRLHSVRICELKAYRVLLLISSLLLRIEQFSLPFNHFVKHFWAFAVHLDIIIQHLGLAELPRLSSLT